MHVACFWWGCKGFACVDTERLHAARYTCVTPMEALLAPGPCNYLT